MNADTMTVRLAQVRARIHQAAERAGRAPEDIELLAVSKRQPLESIRAVYAAGQRAFGESYVQEALEKIAALDGLAIDWHFIGRVQSNKTRQIATHFDWVHGLSDIGHARRLSEQRPAEMAPLNVCLQVDIGGEETKGGVDPAALADLLAGCDELPGLCVRGLMTLPPLADAEDEQRRPFRMLRELRDGLASARRPLECLSMGMSGDLEAAILEGATLVRIGTALFGPRSYT